MTGKEVAERTGVSERSIRRYASSSNDSTVTIKGSVYHFRLIDGVGGRGKVFDFWIGENDERRTQDSVTDDTGGRIDFKRSEDENSNNPKNPETRQTRSVQTNAIRDERNTLNIDPREALKLPEKERQKAELRIRSYTDCTYHSSVSIHQMCRFE